MSFVVGRRPVWTRILLVPSMPFVETIMVSGGTQITDPVVLRFDAGQVETAVLGSTTSITSSVERTLPGEVQPDGSVRFAADAATVNSIINDCGALSRRVRVTIGDDTWGAGYFEIDGEW